MTVCLNCLTILVHAEKERKKERKKEASIEFVPQGANSEEMKKSLIIIGSKCISCAYFLLYFDAVSLL